ncbi:MAG: hypothetical protein K9J79_00045 [Desulfobacteraceae bacterium]|nr:hypothetical protein [Desulfobacteraceae bacterium]
MADKKEISSTEKLLKTIRSSGDKETNSQPEEHSAPGPGKHFKQRWLPSRSRGFLGVEIFRDRLNLVHTSKGKTGWHTVDADSVSLPEGLSLEHPDFPYFLKTRLQNMIKPGKTDIWVCLPPSKGEIWNVHVPKVKKRLTNAVYWSARKEKSFDENEYFFDYRIKDEIADQGIQKLVAEVCIASAREIRLYKEIFSEIGYPLAGITLPAFSLENLFIHKLIDPGDDPYAVLYIGEDASYIDIHGRHTTLFNRVIKTGRDSILDSLIMEHTGQGGEQEDTEIPGLQTEGPAEGRALISRQQAARQLKGQGNGSPEKSAPEADADVSGRQLFDSIRPALERLARQLERTIDHSVNVLTHPAPERIYICGGISFLPGLEEFFSEQLGIPAEIMDILGRQTEATAAEIRLLEHDERLSLVSTAALAMPSEKTINFLHTAGDMDREREALRNTNLIAAACAILFVLTAGWWWMARHELELARKKTAEVQQQMEQYSPRIQTEDIARLAGRLEEKKNELRAYSRKLQPVAVLTELNQVTPENIELLNVRMEPGNNGNTKGNNKAGALMVEGFVRSDPSLFETHLTGYLLRLRRSPLFVDSNIRKSAPETLNTGDDVYRFTINIDLKQA